MDGVQLPQGYSHFEETVYFLPFSSQRFLVHILSTSEGWKAEHTKSKLYPGDAMEQIYMLLGDTGITWWLSSTYDKDLWGEELYKGLIIFLEKEIKVQQ